MRIVFAIQCLAVPRFPSRFHNGLRFHYQDYTPSHMLEFLLLSARFFALFNLPLSFSITHTRTRTHTHSISRSFLQLTSCLKSSNGRQVDMLRLNIISAAWNKVRQILGAAKLSMGKAEDKLSLVSSFVARAMESLLLSVRA